MSNKKPARGGAGSDVADPRFVPVAKAFARAPGFSLMESKSGAMRGLMLHGKSFGMSQHGRFILKLDEERVAALVVEGIGKPFRPGAGRSLSTPCGFARHSPPPWRICSFQPTRRSSGAPLCGKVKDGSEILSSL